MKTASLKNGMDAIFQAGERVRPLKLPLFVNIENISCTKTFQLLFYISTNIATNTIIASHISTIKGKTHFLCLLYQPYREGAWGNQ